MTVISPLGAATCALATALLVSAPTWAREGAADQLATVSDEVIVVTADTAFNQSLVTDAMKAQQTPLTSPLALIDNLPGISIQEGDTFGFDDWSTTITIRGFQTSLADQQIGITIDGLPNGGSNYGGGSKANRYIDSANIGGIEVSQGTADIASRSNEALGGTVNFLTDDPLDDRRLRASVSLGEFEAQRYYVRYDTGALADDLVRAWVSLSHQKATDWINGAAENERDHIAAKFIADADPVTLTGYISYDDTHEDNYQRLFSEAEYQENPEWDRLIDEWVGNPYVDQVYRRGWSTLRENFFTYLKADAGLGDVDLTGGAYYHRNFGRGDWVPPYIVDTFDDGDGAPHSELAGGSYFGTPLLGQIFFVDANGVALTPDPDCVSSITFPYGGGGAQYDAACYPAGVIPVQSYRHTHYKRDRYGVTADAAWNRDFGDFGAGLRGGIWYEDGTRSEHRDWHKITDARVGYEFDETPYWTQYDREYPASTFRYYAEASGEFAGLSLSVGVKQFLVDVSRKDLFGLTSDAEIDSDSDLLLSLGAVYDTPVDGLSLFAGYAENFKALGDEILERPDSDLSNLEPETSENIEAGLRYGGPFFSGSVTYFTNDFENRIIFLDNNTDAGPDYLIGTNGTYFNAGGIDSEGIEVSLEAPVSSTISAFVSYSYVDATYIGTGDAAVDGALGITPGNRVVGVADHLFSGSLDWLDGPYNAGLSVKYTGDRYVTFANDWAADSYVITDVYLGVRGEGISEVLTGISADLVVNNLFDEDYLGGISGNGAWIGAPRTVVFTLSMDF
ncbi:TonB-dependent receptor [Pacificimonas flava]|uniref:TonB-dependent receptor n=2 Tax=Pacificimonas TaxID=1960290 RepID=A0A219B2S8_9SPHN|nr:MULTISPECIES: TonB-dependent receptor [Pacificimonas]MBZ6378264.1 TonB-dependent receptor [Pacificimonas aurantium]OWV32118.1 TonB-dependent receptor [Pacificimonas flava]